MVEGTLRSIDPLAYYVNNVADLDKEVVTAHKQGDQERIKSLLSKSKYDYDVFICINKNWHAFLLCVTVGPAEPLLDELMPNAETNPFHIPGVNFCYKIELTFEEVNLKMYKIKKKFCMFKDVKDSVKKSYYIGKYKGTSPYGLQFAILRSAPHRYRVLLDDCVEFAKAFCTELLAYCENWREIEEEVNNHVKQAVATGLSVETLSRRIESSAFIGNTFLGGIDVSSFLSGRHGTAFVVALMIFILVYPVVITVVIVKLLA